MVRLLLFRHAKSSWDDPAIADAERPVSARGRRAADAMGQLLADSGYVPDLVLCSPAVRARQTLEIASVHWSPSPIVRSVESLYERLGRDYLPIVQREGGEAACMMLVAHNPAIEDTASTLIGLGDEGLRERVHQKFPTAAVAVIDFPTERWSEVGPGLGQLVAFLRPRDSASALESPRAL